MKHKKMSPKWKRIWLRALRGQSPHGKYTQAQDTLVRTADDFYYVEADDKDTRTEDSFCCLGVLGNEYARLNPDRAYFEDNGWFCFYRTPTRVETAVGVLPPALAKDMGIDISVQKYLSSMNDGEGASFARIAHWIEKNL